MIRHTAANFETPLDCLEEAVRVLARSPGPLIERLEDAYMDALQWVDVAAVQQPHRVALSSIVATLKVLAAGGPRQAEIRRVMEGDASLRMVDEIIAIRDALQKDHLKAIKTEVARAAQRRQLAVKQPVY